MIELQEAMSALENLYNAGFGRALPTFNKAREKEARLAAINLLERYYRPAEKKVSA